jgi:hypothetical protein
VHTQAVFADPAVVAQAGGAIVAGAGGDLSESVAHVLIPVEADIVSGSSAACAGASDHPLSARRQVQPKARIQPRLELASLQ